MQLCPTVSMRAPVSAHEEQAWNQEQLQQPVCEPQSRLWIYREPAVVLGCSQRHAVSAEQVQERAGIGLVTRQAGGGAVLVGPWMLSASIVLPNAHPLAAPGPTESYRWLGSLFASVLRGLGILARTIDLEETRHLQTMQTTGSIAWACYGGFSPWEVVVGQRKIVGLAQVRKRAGVLIVAGLLLEQPAWTLLSKAMGKPPQEADLLAQRTTSCAEQRSRALPLPEVAGALASAFHDVLGTPEEFRETPPKPLSEDFEY